MMMRLPHVMLPAPLLLLHCLRTHLHHQPLVLMPSPMLLLLTALLLTALLPCLCMGAVLLVAPPHLLALLPRRLKVEQLALPS